MTPQASPNEGPHHESETAENPTAARCVLKACHSALFPGALLRCTDTGLRGSSPVEAVVVFQNGTTTTAIYTPDSEQPQLAVYAYRSATGHQYDAMTWRVDHAAPGVVRLRHRVEHTPGIG